jgi:hypothetical protein
MLFLNIENKIREDASKLLAQYKLGIKSGYSVSDSKYHTLHLLIKQRDELQFKLS